MNVSQDTAQAGAEQVPSIRLDDSHRFQALMKEYELATNRLDKTDDRIIQLVGIGLAALGAVLLFLSRMPISETPTGVGSTTTSTITSPQGHLWEEAVLCLMGFNGVYAALFLGFMGIYLWKGRGRPFPGSVTNLVGLRSGRRVKEVENSKKAYAQRGHEELRVFEEDLERLEAYEVLDENSIWRMKLAYSFPPIFGMAAILIVETWLAPNLRSQAHLPSVELWWLLMLLFTGFNSLLIYVEYSSLGHLWLCRVLSYRLNTLLRRKTLLRFDRVLLPTTFFSYSTGNWKPRMSYWMLLGSVAVLFCSVLFIFFAQIYIKSWWQGSLFLTFYLFLMFLQLFVLSGVRHDLHNRHVTFLEEETEYMKNAWDIPQTDVR